MGPAGYILAILGCGEAEAQCQQVQLASARYESRAECLAAQEAALARYDDAGDYPVVVAECRPATQRFATLRADEVRRPEPQGRLNVRTASARR
jgi:hypothetical protein